MATTPKILADIIADTNRMDPDDIALIITDAEWHGSLGDPEDHPISHYISQHLTLATGRHYLVSLTGHQVTVHDLHTRTMLATATLATATKSTKSTLIEVIALIDEGAEGFAELVDTTALDLARLTDAERAEMANDKAAEAFAGFTTDDDPDFFAAITSLYDSIAA